MVDIIEVSAILAAAGVLVGIIYYILDIRNKTKLRNLDVFIRMNTSFNISLMEWQQASFKVMNLQFKDSDDFVKKYGSWDTETPTMMAIHTIANFTDGVGYLLKRKLVSTDYVWDVYGPASISFWEKLKPAIEGVRKEYNEPTIFEPFEYLYNEMKKREQQQASKTA